MDLSSPGLPRQRNARSDVIAAAPRVRDWPAPELNLLPPEKKVRYLRNKLVVDLWVAGRSEPEIKAELKRGQDIEYCAGDAYRLFQRCIRTNPRTGVAADVDPPLFAGEVADLGAGVDLG